MSDDDAMTEWLATYPETDSQQLRALVRQARKEGLPVTCDVSINHVHLTEMDIGYFDPHCRLIPPFRALRDRDVLARFGGEEFVVLMPVSGLEAALEVCERMRQNVAQQPIAHGAQESVSLTVSIGVALITGLPVSVDDTAAAQLMHSALQAADVALYKAKAAGRNQVFAADGPLQAPA